MANSPHLQLVDSTLREGEQHPGVRFTTMDRIDIALALDRFGIDIIEMPTPVASPQAGADIQAIANLSLTARVACHTRCRPDEINQAADCGADIVHVYMGSSPTLREHGHGRDLCRILKAIDEAAIAVSRTKLASRFSCEDAFRTPIGELSRILLHAEEAGFQRVGIADTVGAACPKQVTEVIGFVRQLVATEIEFHGHNDGGCAVANAHAAFLAGASHIDVTALGLGERNGITALSDFVARLWLTERASVARYCLPELIGIDELVAERALVSVPFSACISGANVFTHKAGPHIKAVVSNPETYEVLDPAAFGRKRSLDVAHRLTGRHAISFRVRELGVQLSEEQIKRITEVVKLESERKPIGLEGLDRIIYRFNTEKGHSHGNTF